MTKSLNLIASIFSLVFTIMLVFLSHSNYDIAHNIVGFFLEIVTIPIVLMTIGLLVINVIRWSKEKWTFKNSTFYALIALILSVAIMIISTLKLI